MHKSIPPRLLAFFVVYVIASLIHFIHNAEFLLHYPNLPTSWTGIGVYLFWVGMTTLGLIGLLFMARGFYHLGLVIVVIYAALGIDSLAHYVVAPFMSHTTVMNITILLEVATAILLLIEAARLMLEHRLHKKQLR